METETKMELDPMEEAHRWEDSLDDRLGRAIEDGILSREEWEEMTVSDKEDWLNNQNEF